MAGGPKVRGVVDRAAQAVARVAMAGWFRQVEKVGMEEVPTDRPVLLVASHLNGFVDPALLVATAPRMPRFLAKATLWKVKPAALALDLVGVLPVHRATDGSTAGNTRVFAACHGVLAARGTVAIFPEGTTHDEARLKTIHTGAARIALGARANGTRGLLIVPVGLVYEDKAAPRTRCLVRAGHPIDLDAEIGQFVDPGTPDDDTNRVAVDRLTAEIAARMRRAAIDYENRLELAALMQAAAVYLRTPDLSPVAQVPLAALEPLVRRLSKVPPEQRHDVTTETALYRLILDGMKLTDADVVAGTNRRRVSGKEGRRLAIVAALTPLAAAGLVIDGPTYLAVQRLSDRPMARVSRANFTLLASLAAYPLTWLAWGLVLRRAGIRHGIAVALLLGPVAGHAAVAATEQGVALWHTRVGFRRTLRFAGDLPELVEERDRLITTIERALAAEPVEPAAPTAG